MVTAGGPGRIYACQVYDAGRSNADGTAKSATRAGVVLVLHQLNAAATVPAGRVLDAVDRGTHMEADYPSRWTAGS